jgi:hypothetical protein
MEEELFDDGVEQTRYSLSFKAFRHSKLSYT